MHGEVSNECVFCRELSGKMFDESQLYQQLSTTFPGGRLILETSHWSLVPTAGCFVEGYVVAVHNGHTLSLIYCNIEAQKDLFQLIEYTRLLFLKTYQKKMIFFEHGSIHKNVGANSVDHTHIHFVPFDSPLWESFVEDYRPEYYKVDSILQVGEIVRKHQLLSYLLFGDTDGCVYVIAHDPKKYSSQFFRMYISSKIAQDDIQWDWKKEIYADNMYKTYNKLLCVKNSLAIERMCCGHCE